MPVSILGKFIKVGEVVLVRIVIFIAIFFAYLLSIVSSVNESFAVNQSVVLARNGLNVNFLEK